MSLRFCASALVALLNLFAVVFVSYANAQGIPPLVKFSGTLRDEAGNGRTGVVNLAFAIYGESEGGTALWSESQNVTLDAKGTYSVLLGSSKPEGLPVSLFVNGDA